MNGTTPLARTANRFKCTTPIALAIKKRGRLCIVAKLTTFFDSDEVILATAWRSQHGTVQAISLPATVIDFARSAGALDYYLRDDRTHGMYRLPLDRFLDGRLARDGERYAPLAWFEAVPWREWRYADRTLDLTPPELQLALWPAPGGE